MSTIAIEYTREELEWLLKYYQRNAKCTGEAIDHPAYKAQAAAVQRVLLKLIEADDEAKR